MPKTAKKRAAGARKKNRSKTPAKKKKSVFLRNFVGRVSQNRDGTINVTGVNNAPAGMRKNPGRKKAKARKKGARR